MSFTLQNAKEIAESLLPGDASIPGDKVLTWGNEFIQDLVGSWGYAEVEDATTFADMTADTGVALPAAFVSMVGVEDENGVTYDRYYIRNKKLFAKDDGAYTVTYISYPTQLSNLTTAVGLHDALQYPLAYWLAYHYADLDPSKQALYAKAPGLEAKYQTRFKSVMSKLETDSENESFLPGPLW